MDGLLSCDVVSGSNAAGGEAQLTIPRIKISIPTFLNDFIVGLFPHLFFEWEFGEMEFE